MKKRIVLLLLLLLMSSVVTVAQSSDAATQIDDYLTRLTELGYSGSILVIQDGETLLDTGYGYANETTEALITSDTIFNIGSITKLFTAVAVLQLHEEGLLNVEDTLDQYFDDLPQDKQAITIQQVLTMTAGLAEYHDTEGDFQAMQRDEAYTAIINDPLIATPGTEDNYSNSGYTLLAILIEAVSGQSYQDYIHEHILNPLEMTRTGFRGETFDNIAYADNVFDGYGSPADWEYSWVLVGNGGMVASNADVARFMNALLDYELVSQETLAYWVDLSDTSGWSGAAGGGSATAYNAAAFFNLDIPVFIYHMTNSADFQAEFVSAEFFALFEGGELQLPPEVNPDTDLLAYDCYAGMYILEDGTQFLVSTDEANLYISPIGQSAVNTLLNIDNANLQSRLEDRNQQADRLIAAILERDFEVVSTVFEINFPPDSFEPFWANIESDFGTFEAYTILGTNLSEFGQNELRTLVELNFANGIQYASLYWEQEELVGFGIDDVPESSQQTLFPIANHTFTTFSLFADVHLSVEFVIEDNSATSLTISLTDSKQSAIREESACLE